VSVNVNSRDASLRLEGTNVVATPSVIGRKLDVEAVLARLIDSSSTLAPAELPLTFQTFFPSVTDVSEAKARLEAILAAPITLVPDASVPGNVGPGGSAAKTWQA
jgi:hypothetical protein